MKIKLLIAATALSLSSSMALHAAVSSGEAAKLAGDLTPTGAEKAANADGSIPAWTGKGVENPPAGDGYSNPYAAEKPLYTITQANMAEYADMLSEGQKALFEKFGADGYKIDVYPTHRSFAAPQWYYDGSVSNAVGATLEDDGQRIAGNVAGVPFPIPQSGLEALWNHMVRWMGYEFKFTAENYYVDSNGSPVLSTVGDNYWEFPMFMQYSDPTRDYGAKDADVRWAYLRTNFQAPSRRAGEILLVHEPGADYTGGKGRSAWQYLTGQRRVRKAPAVSFDTPQAATGGTNTYDDAYIYNGSPERYDWKLVGKKEMIVPYNNYDFIFKYDIKELMDKRFVADGKMRFEKHRVWIVEGTLKDGSRHVYGKRRYLIDEDSWNALEGMRWDKQGKLWRTSFALTAQLWDDQAPFGAPTVGYDLLNNIYNIAAKPQVGSFSNKNGQPVSFFSPQGMARTGVR
jgi:hypothetical protein